MVLILRETVFNSLKFNMNNKELADIIFKHYYDVYGGEVQGCCPVIADDIQKAIGGEIVLGLNKKPAMTDYPPGWIKRRHTSL